jgi:hypothetical protein
MWQMKCGPAYPAVAWWCGTSSFLLDAKPILSNRSVCSGPRSYAAHVERDTAHQSLPPRPAVAPRAHCAGKGAVATYGRDVLQVVLVTQVQLKPCNPAWL